jgi:hypothetical protein
MTVLLLIGAVLWVNVDASRELGGEPHDDRRNSSAPIAGVANAGAPK